MLASDLRALQEKYQQICEDTITEDVIDEVVDELVEELIWEGYGEDEAYALVEEATDTFIVEAKVTFGHDTTARRASGAPVGARRKYGKRKAGEALRAAGEKAKGAVDTAKKKAAGAAAGAAIAGSIAKDEARRAGRAAQHSVTKAADAVKRAPGEAKKKAKSGIKGFIKRQAEKVVKRMSEDVQKGEQLDEFLGAGAQKAVDGATKRIQGGLERMGVKINRTPKPTARPSGQTQNTIRQNQQSQMNSFAPEGEVIGEATPRGDATPVKPMKPGGPLAPFPYGPVQKFNKGGTVKKGCSEEYDAYDVVLEYLMSEDHASSVEEAHHIMINMDADTIQSIVENRAAARSAGGYKDDSKKQTDPSKSGFTGISGSIADIMRQNREIEARNKKKK